MLIPVERAHRKLGTEIMPKITLAVSSTAYEKLQRRARHLGKPVEKLSQEILEASVRDELGEPRSAAEILEAAGLLVHMSAALREMIIPDVPLDEVRAAMSTTEGPSLSDIVLQQRGPTG